MILSRMYSNMYTVSTILRVVVLTWDYNWYLKPTIMTQWHPSNYHCLHGKKTPYNYNLLQHRHIPVRHLPLRHERWVKPTLGFCQNSLFKIIFYSESSFLYVSYRRLSNVFVDPKRSTGPFTGPILGSIKSFHVPRSSLDPEQVLRIKFWSSLIFP